MTNKILVELNIHNGHIATCNCCSNLNRYTHPYDPSEENVSYSCDIGLLKDFIPRVGHGGYDMMLCGATCSSIEIQGN